MAVCRQQPVALSLAGLTLCVAATGYGEHASASLDVLDVVVGVVALGLVPTLLRWPVWGALALAVLAAVSPLATPPSTVATLQVARMRQFSVTMGVATAGIAAHAIRGLWNPMPGLSYTWWLVLVIVVHAGLVGWGALAAARRAVIASLEERALRAETEQGRRVAEARAAERTRIAREMHDVLAHRLSLLATYAGALEYRADLPSAKVSEAAAVIRSGVHQALNELRDVISVLRDDTDDSLDRPVPELTALPTLVDETRAVGTPVTVEVSLGTEPPGTTGRAAYRVLQEALTNARKHAPGQPVRISLDGTPGKHLVIDVTNSLSAEPATIPGTGTGLVGLTERVRLAGGQLDHQLTAREFRLHALLPWPA